MPLREMPLTERDRKFGQVMSAAIREALLGGQPTEDEYPGISSLQVQALITVAAELLAFCPGDTRAVVVAEVQTKLGEWTEQCVREFRRSPTVRS